MSTAAVTPQPTQAAPQGLTLVTATPAAKAKSAVLMEVVVNRDALLAEVAAAQGITSSRTTIPILSNLLIEAQDGFLKIFGVEHRADPDHEGASHGEEGRRCHRPGAEAV